MEFTLLIKVIFFYRVILENATVRAAAVSALARFGALCDDLLPNILVLLSRYPVFLSMYHRARSLILTATSDAKWIRTTKFEIVQLTSKQFWSSSSKL
jgi:hypothetical protein